MLSLHWALTGLIGLASLTCTGWAIESNDRGLLVIALVVLLVPHSPTLRAQMEASRVSS